MAAYVDGLLTAGDIDRVDAHVDRCGECQGDLSALAIARTRSTQFADEQSSFLQQAEIEPGQHYGRYIALAELGRGAMGVVMRAYDPELDRAIAVKIVRPGVWQKATSNARRLMRLEAQAMAKLSSPNVVTIYDVVSDEDGLALAMELVDGTTLREFCAGKDEWSALLGTCIAAGKGLQAAHEASIVHRDFKPDNILCSDDGRVLVTDFGLAQLIDDSARSESVAGTPAYIAPEVIDSGIATPVSDQFSFCVTTYEVLYGERPFSATDWDGLIAQARAGVFRDSNKRRVPSSVRQTLLRGMHADPNRRFESMEKLLTVLQRALQRRSRLWRAAVVFGVVALAVGALAYSRLSAHPSVSCEVSDNALESAWGSGQKAKIASALGDLGTSRVALDRLESAFDSYKAAWRTSRQQVCEATHKRGEQSAALLDQRMACLDRREGEFTALSRVLSGAANRQTGTMAIEAVQHLPSPKRCVRAQELGLALPNDGELRTEIMKGYEATDRAAALVATGGFDDGLALLREILATDAAKSDARLRGQAAFTQGLANSVFSDFDAAEQSFFVALEAAQRAQDDRLVAQIWIELVRTDGALAHRFALARSHQNAAKAALARVAQDDELDARYTYSVAMFELAEEKASEALLTLDSALAMSETLHGGAHLDIVEIHGAMCEAHRLLRDYDKAEAQCKQALAVGHEVFGENHPRLVSVYKSFGNVEIQRGRYAVAREWYQKTIDVTEESGERSPVRALAMNNIGASWIRQGDPSKATAAFEQSRQLFERYHPDDVSNFMPVAGLANVAHMTGDYAKAARYYGEALAIMKRTLGEESPKRALRLLYNLALVRVELGEKETATAAFEQVIEIAQQLDANHPMIASALDALTAEANKEGDLDGAVLYAERALEVARRAYQDDDFALAWSLARLGNLYRMTKRPGQAVALLEEARVIVEGAQASTFQRGNVRYQLAQALHDSGDFARSVSLAKAAREELLKSKERAAEPVLKELDRWLPQLEKLH